MEAILSGYSQVQWWSSLCATKVLCCNNSNSYVAQNCSVGKSALGHQGGRQEVEEENEYGMRPHDEYPRHVQYMAVFHAIDTFF